MQLVCPAGNLPALQAAVDAGANAVYAGFRDQTNARAFPGLNFSDDELRAGIRYAHAKNAKVYLALNTYPDSARLKDWYAAVDKAAMLGADADPLLLIETIDVPQAREYVEKVVAAYWIYQRMMGAPVNTLDAVASGARAVPIRLDYVAPAPAPLQVAEAVLSGTR